MPTTTTLQLLPLPVPGDAPTVPADLAALAGETEKKLVQVYASTSARDAAITAPEAGMVAYLSGTKVFTFYDGTTWLPLVSNLQSITVAAVDAVNSGGQITLRGAGSNKSWGVKSQGNTLLMRYDFEGVPSTVLMLEQTDVEIPAGITFTRSGVVQPVLRSGSTAPNNGVGVDGDWYARY